MYTGDRMEEANEPARTTGPALANKIGTEVGWVTLLSDRKCLCSVPSSLLLWLPSKSP